MRKKIVGSENEAGHVIRYHSYTGSDNKDPDNNAQFCLCICGILSGS